MGPLYSFRMPATVCLNASAVRDGGALLELVERFICGSTRGRRPSAATRRRRKRWRKARSSWLLPVDIADLELGIVGGVYKWLGNTSTVAHDETGIGIISKFRFEIIDVPGEIKMPQTKTDRRSSSNRLQFNPGPIIRSYLDGESELSISKRTGYERCVIRRRLIEAGVIIRNGSEANRIRMSRVSITNHAL